MIQKRVTFITFVIGIYFLFGVYVSAADPDKHNVDLGKENVKGEAVCWGDKFAKNYGIVENGDVLILSVAKSCCKQVCGGVKRASDIGWNGGGCGTSIDFDTVKIKENMSGVHIGKFEGHMDCEGDGDKREKPKWTGSATACKDIEGLSRKDKLTEICERFKILRINRSVMFNLKNDLRELAKEHDDFEFSASDRKRLSGLQSLADASPKCSGPLITAGGLEINRSKVLNVVNNLTSTILSNIILPPTGPGANPISLGTTAYDLFENMQIVATGIAPCDTTVTDQIEKRQQEIVKTK